MMTYLHNMYAAIDSPAWVNIMKIYLEKNLKLQFEYLWWNFLLYLKELGSYVQREDDHDYNCKSDHWDKFIHYTKE